MGQQPCATAAQPASQPIGGKRERTDVPALDARKRPQRGGSLAGGVPQTPMSSRREVVPSTSPDTGYDPGSGVASGSVPHGSGGFLGRQAAPAVADSLAATVDELRQKLAAAHLKIDELERREGHLYQIHDRAEETADKAYALARQLRDRMSQLETMDGLVQDLRLEQARLRGHLDCLMQSQPRSVVQPPPYYSAPAPPNPPGPGRGMA